MKPYNYIESSLLPAIQTELFAVINSCVNVDSITQWNFLDKKALKNAPAVLKFCKDLKLIIEDFSITVLRENLNKHIDALPVPSNKRDVKV